MTVRDFLKELHQRLHDSFAAVNKKGEDYVTRTVQETRLLDEVTDEHVAEITSAVQKLAADIRSGGQ